MHLARARYLVSPAGREALAALDPALGALEPVRLASELRRTFAPFEASALAEQLTLRWRARDRLGESGRWLLTSDGLEMMTHPAVATRRAARLATLGLPVADLTAGLGGDLAACVDAGMLAVGVERDGVTALLAAANVPGAGIVRGDAARPPVDVSRHAIVIDPARRTAAGRRFEPAAFSPPWDVALGLLDAAPAGVLKAAPGIEHRHLPPGCESEWVQLGRSLRECAAWTGAGVTPGLRRAVLLPAGVELTSEAPEAPAEPIAPCAIVFDPESCVTRAGLVRHLGHVLGARLMDPQVAYLTAPEPAFHTMAATFEVLEVLPFAAGRLRERLRAARWRPAEVRRRAFPVEPDELLRILGPIEGEPVTLLLTTIAGKRLAIVARRLHGDIPDEITKNCSDR